MLRVLWIITLLLAGCVASEDRIEYTVEGNEMLVTLSDGSIIRLPCLFSSSREASRISRDADTCVLTDEQRQFILTQEDRIQNADNNENGDG